MEFNNALMKFSETKEGKGLLEIIKKEIGCDEWHWDSHYQHGVLIGLDKGFKAGQNSKILGIPNMIEQARQEDRAEVLEEVINILDDFDNELWIDQTRIRLKLKIEALKKRGEKK